MPRPLIEDGNRMMSPEDIAALIGNTAVDGLPETISPIEAEERPLMPDLSNPSKLMSADDIAALIANM